MSELQKIKIVVASGKGGVGKSMLTSVLAMLFAREGHSPYRDGPRVVAVDCDVDAPNLAIWLNEIKNWEKVKKISVSEKPVIDNSKLTKKEVEQCVEKCRFNALKVEKGKLKLNPFLCEGCGACEIFCPEAVIKMRSVKSGEIKTKKTKYDFPLVSGQLYPGETGSGKVVTELKKAAEKFNYEIMLIDSAPGTGCPVIASLQGSNFAILITEPTPSGFSDLKRVLKVVNHFNIPYGLVINKWDINKDLSRKIEKWAGENPEGEQSSLRGRFLGKISYDKKIFEAIANLTPIMETNLEAKKEIKKIFNNLKLWLDQ
jgi:MinD superfamily P-loop ATPase